MTPLAQWQHQLQGDAIASKKKLSQMGERGSRRMVLWDVPPIFPQGSDAPVGRGRLQVKSKHFSWPQYTKMRFVGLVSSAIAYGCLIHTQHRQQQIWSNVACIYLLVTWVHTRTLRTLWFSLQCTDSGNTKCGATKLFKTKVSTIVGKSGNRKPKPGNFPSKIRKN